MKQSILCGIILVVSAMMISCQRSEQEMAYQQKMTKSQAEAKSAVPQKVTNPRRHH